MTWDKDKSHKHSQFSSIRTVGGMSTDWDNDGWRTRPICMNAGYWVDATGHTHFHASRHRLRVSQGDACKSDYEISGSFAWEIELDHAYSTYHPPYIAEKKTILLPLSNFLATPQYSHK